MNSILLSCAGVKYFLNCAYLLSDNHSNNVNIILSLPTLLLDCFSMDLCFSHVEVFTSHTVLHYTTAVMLRCWHNTRRLASSVNQVLSSIHYFYFFSGDWNFHAPSTHMCMFNQDFLLIPFLLLTWIANKKFDIWTRCWKYLKECCVDNIDSADFRT